MIAWLALGSPVSGFTFGSGWTPFSWSPIVDGTADQVFAYYKVATSADVGAGLHRLVDQQRQGHVRDHRLQRRR